MTGYEISTANDNAQYTGRNPKAWTLYGATTDSNPGKDDAAWEVIATVTNDTKLKDVNYTTYAYTLSSETPKAYQSFKWVITARSGGGNGVIQVSEFRPTFNDALVEVPFPDDETGILPPITSPMKDGPVYNLAGQRLSRTRRGASASKGICIIQGKKFIR